VPDTLKRSQNKRKDLVHTLCWTAARLDRIVCVYYELETALVARNSLVTPTLCCGSES
jgi:hypothetical protein